LLTKNAHEQGLPTQKASSAADFVINELYNLESFLSAIEDMFSNHKEAEEHRKALFSLRQGNKSITEFNIQFNTLLYTVMLSEESKIEVYEAAIKPKIVKLGVNRGGWSELDTLREKQSMAVKLAIDVYRVAQINQHKYQVLLPCIKFKRAPVAVIPTATKSTVTPMDINAVLADLGFTFANWRRECTDCNLCFRCMKPFDKTHVDVRGCPLSDDQWLVKSNILKVWKSWGGALRKDCESAMSTGDRGKKWESVSKVREQSPLKRRSISGPAGEPTSSLEIPLPNTDRPVASTSYVDAIVGEPMSLGEILFERGISDFQMEDDCKSFHFVKTSPLHSCPFFTGRLMQKDKLLDLSVLVDSGASISFISDCFIDS
jgi:hypothetical protein